MRRLLLVLLLLTACNSPPVSPPLVVLATGEDGDWLAERLVAFTDQTGIPVAVSWGPSDRHADRLIEKSGVPADILLTDNVLDIWRAGDEGALRPLQTQRFAAVPDALKDPDGLWAAIDRRPYRIVHRPGQPPGGTGFDALADPGLPGRLCMTSVALPQNQALLGFLIEDLGERPAERLVRRWAKNLARAPFASQEELLAALGAGECDFAIVVAADNPAGLASHIPEPRYADITALGIGRHAAHPEAAQRLAHWLLGERQLADEGEPAQMAVGIAGWRAEEARRLAERAGYR